MAKNGGRASEWEGRSCENVRESDRRRQDASLGKESAKRVSKVEPKVITWRAKAIHYPRKYKYTRSAQRKCKHGRTSRTECSRLGDVDIVSGKVRDPKAVQVCRM